MTPTSKQTVDREPTELEALLPFHAAGTLNLRDARRVDEALASGDVEAVLYEHPAVREAAVAGVPHDVLGEDIGAWIVLAPDGVADAEELRAFCAERLSDYKVPRRWTFVEDLPRNATGKVLKRDLPLETA